MFNPIDSLISFFSPRAGYERAVYRDAMMEKRGYAAAQFGRRNSGWTASGSSANAEARLAFAVLRDRARAWVRDGWAGQRILDVITSHVVGTGIMTVPNTGSDRADNRYKLAREQWEETSDIEGVMDYGGQQALLLRSMIEGGDSVLRFVRQQYTSAREPVPFRLKALEGDHIDVTQDSRIGQGVRLGVSLGDWDERKGLYLYKYHPGEMTVSNFLSSDLVPYDELCHLYRPLRLGQLRGITWFAPILLPGKDIQDLMEAAIIQSRTQASFAGFLKRAAGVVSPFETKNVDAKSGRTQKVTTIQPGQIQDIGESEITFATPSGQSVFGEAFKWGLRALAAGAGITYDQLTGDLTQANYSSLRAGKIEFRRLVEQLQWQMMVPMVCRRIDRAFENYAILSGHIPDRRDGYRVDHIMPAIEPIDPLKDLEADILAVRSGRLSPQEFISAWGRDWRKVVEDFDSFFSFADDVGIVLDIDPRRPKNGGSAPQPQNQPLDQTGPANE